jgi:hypothetical protein
MRTLGAKRSLTRNEQQPGETVGSSLLLNGKTKRKASEFRQYGSCAIFNARCGSAQVHLPFGKSIAG